MDAITRYLEQKTAQGCTPRTVISYRTSLRNLNKFKDLETITKDDLVKYFAAPFKSEGTRFLATVHIKTYFKETGKPEVASWLRAKKPRETLSSEDILTASEVQQLIDATDSPYWKSLIAVLFDSGARIAEIIGSLRWDDLVMGEYMMMGEDGKEKIINAFMVHIESKKTGGYRKIVLPVSTSYLLNLRETTPKRDDGIIFYLKYRRVFEVLGELGRRARIKKHVHAHAFRHCRATIEIQKGTPEPIVRKMLGWSPASTIPSRYIHMSDQDVINSQLGKVQRQINANIKIAEKVDTKTVYDEMEKVKAENSQLYTEMAKIGSDNAIMSKKLAEMQEQMAFIMRIQAEKDRVMKEKGLI